MSEAGASSLRERPEPSASRFCDWRWAAFRAALAIVFGISVEAVQMLVSALAFFAVLRPPWAFAAVVWLFAAFAFADGVVALIAFVRSVRATRARFWLLVPQAILGIAIGVLAITQQPRDNSKGGLMLVYDVGIWAIPRGILELVAAIQLRNEMPGGFWLGLVGVLSVVFGVLLFVAPGSGRWIGGYAFVVGMMLLVFALRLRAFAQANERSGVPVAAASH